MNLIRKRRLVPAAILAVCASTSMLSAQAQPNRAVQSDPISIVEQPDAERTRQSLRTLLERYPPSVRNVLALDPGLLTNQSYLAPYPALVSFLNSHPDVVRNPSYYIGDPERGRSEDPAAYTREMWRDVFQAIAVFAGFGMAIGLIVWLIRTLVDYRRWSRLARVQTEVHTKLVDRFTANEDLLAYIQSPAGARFLQSAPISLDAGPRSIGAPVSRILWSVQGGVVMIAAGIGFEVVSARIADAQPLSALGVIAIALGLGFVISAAISFLISRRLGLLESAPTVSPQV